jgi:hypothetical protein
MKSKTNKLIGHQIVAWLLLTILFLVPLGLLAHYLPEVLAAGFLVLLIVATVLHAKTKGFWSGVRLFFKEILFGW